MENSILTEEERELLTEEKEHCESNGLIYAPNSVYHFDRSGKEVVHLKIAYERLNDFIEFLFDHSEHCDHISRSDAWKEFEEYEYKNRMKIPKP